MDQLDCEETSGILGRLTSGQRKKLERYSTRKQIGRGETLVAEGTAADSLFIVLHGAFVLLNGKGGGCGERCRGQLIGEDAFFSGGDYAESVVAKRDGELLAISRADYDALLRDAPEFSRILLETMAHRLRTEALPKRVERQAGRIIAFVAGGHVPTPVAFFDRMERRLSAGGHTVINHAVLSAQVGDVSHDGMRVAEWLDRKESISGPIFLFADFSLTDWTRQCIRQADEVVMVTEGEAPGGELTPTEAMVSSLHPVESRRLVRIHKRRTGVVSGTTPWLRRMAVHMHHHVSLEDDSDLDALIRFLTGRAVGFVAGGGGGHGPAHVGIYRAFSEYGATFDIFMGTSVGAAMLAGFAFLGDHNTLTRGTQEIFVRRRSFKRLTWPRHALLDHKVFDDALAEAYGRETLVEDCWKPFIAVATNLSAKRPELIRSGLLWQAVRASSAIPCVLPPFITPEGEILVDGGVMDNNPLRLMQQVKAGPNLVVQLGRRERRRVNMAYGDFPGRKQLLASLFIPNLRKVRAPRIMSMLFSTILAHQQNDLPAGPQDIVLSPPNFPGASMMSFDRHMDVFNAAYRWAKTEILERLQERHDVLRMMVPSAATMRDLVPETVPVMRRSIA